MALGTEGLSCDEEMADVLILQPWAPGGCSAQAEGPRRPQKNHGWAWVLSPPVPRALFVAAAT